MLKEGDIIELKDGHTVYAKIPAHFAFSNRIGCFDEVVKTEVTIGKNKNGLNTDFFKGRYVVTGTSVDGGGEGHGPGDVYPDGHHVKASKFVEKIDSPINVEFYETGYFTAMIKDLQPIGRAKAQWSEEC